MNKKNHSYTSLFVWIITLIVIGSLIGLLTRTEVTAWYSTLPRSALTPPNYVFPVVWTILYTVIGICGWRIWRTPSFSRLRVIKALFVS